MDNHPHFKRILFTKNQIEDKCKELGSWVDEQYKNSENLIIVGLLKGCVPFLSQLIKNVNKDHKIDFMTASSYHGGTESSGDVKIVMDLNESIRDADILIVEDIIDTGRTLKKIVEILETRKPHSIKIMTLIDKPEGRVDKSIKADKVGFIIDKVFIAGFGLDVNEKLRNLPFIGEFNTDFLDKY